MVLWQSDSAVSRPLISRRTVTVQGDPAEDGETGADGAAGHGRSGTVPSQLQFHDYGTQLEGCLPERHRLPAEFRGVYMRDTGMYGRGDGLGNHQGHGHEYGELRQDANGHEHEDGSDWDGEEEEGRAGADEDGQGQPRVEAQERRRRQAGRDCPAHGQPGQAASQGPVSQEPQRPPPESEVSPPSSSKEL